MTPVCISQPHWEGFLSESKTLLNKQPTDGIGAAGLTLKDIETFPAVCDMQNKPLDALANKYNPGYLHTFVSFLGQLDSSDIKEIRNTVQIRITEFDNKVFLLTASIYDWYNIVEAGLNRPGKATLYVEIRNFFLMTKFSSLFSKLTLNPILE